MPEIIDKTDEFEQDIITDENIRIDDLKVNPAPFKFKQVTPVVQDNVTAQIPSEENIKKAEKLLAEVLAGQQQVRKDADNGTGKLPIARLDKLKIKSNTPQDFSQVSEDDVYNLDFNIEARPFFLGDSLKIDLRDTNYVGRWVNTDKRRIGQMLGRGFSYIVEEDLNSALDLGIFKDAQGHFVNGDVVAMKIQKAIYFAALRAAHTRAVNSINPKGAHKAAIGAANEYMQKQAGNFNELMESKKVKIYSPDLDI